MKYTILFIPSGSYLYIYKGFKFPESALYSEEEIVAESVPDSIYEILFFSTKEDALQIFDKPLWSRSFSTEADYVYFSNEQYFITKDSECFEIIEIEEK